MTTPNNFSMTKFAFTNNIANNIVGKAMTESRRILVPLRNTLLKWVDENICCYFEITGHYDSYISKSCVSVLHNKYLSKKYGNTLYDVDPAFALCTASLEKVRQKVSAFPELVNKTIAPGIYTLVMDAEGSRMIIVKEVVLSKDDRSDNGIITSISNYSTKCFFIGKNRKKWCDQVKKEIDDLVSSISKTNQDNNRIKYTVMGTDGEDNMKEISVRPMNMLSFPAKDDLLELIRAFLSKKKIYEELATPHRLGILLSGKPGVGKTAFAFSVPQYFEMECVSVNLDIFDKKHGDAVFSRPNTVFIVDEIDSQLMNRYISNQESIQKDPVMSNRLIQLIRGIDSMDRGSIIIATTNYPERLDPALLRSGRFDEIVDMGDISESFAKEMISSRGCNPEEVLRKIEKFPVNPAYLEQVIIRHIMQVNGIGVRKTVSLDELGLHEEKVPGEETKNSDSATDPDAKMVEDDEDDEDDILDDMEDTDDEESRTEGEHDDEYTEIEEKGYLETTTDEESHFRNNYSESDDEDDEDEEWD
ncbi:MAG: ATP-binding protein [Lactobacillus sp.]|nr:ATP-binding protein [Lactobacillus sp.]